MDRRNNIATFIWAIACASTIHALTEISTTESPGATDTLQDVNMWTTSTLRPTQDVNVSVSMTPDTTTFISNTTTTTLSTTKSFTTDIVSTTTIVKSTEPEDCMVSRKDEFIACFESLGNNAMNYIATKNLTGFLDDMCDANRSKPYMECIKRHFQECPDFINRIEVQVLQFGPYHIKDIIYFSSIDQMCSCVTGLVCIQELIKVKQLHSLDLNVPYSPWQKLPNYKAICANDTFRYIGCVRGNLRQCQSPLTKRYGDAFTNEDAEDVKRIYDFSKENCGKIKEDDFSEKYKCIEEKSTSVEFRDCIQAAESLPNARKLCQMRDCVKEVLEDACESNELIPLYIDAVNIYLRDSVRLLNKQCTLSSAPEIGISIAAVIVSFLFVVLI